MGSGVGVLWVFLERIHVGGEDEKSKDLSKNPQLELRGGEIHK